MAKIQLDSCDICNELINNEKEGIEISGENIAIAWLGKGSPKGDAFRGSGIYAPMNGRVTLAICKSCLIQELNLTRNI
jgi:hypothetical protein